MTRRNIFKRHTLPIIVKLITYGRPTDSAIQRTCTSRLSPSLWPCLLASSADTPTNTIQIVSACHLPLDRLSSTFSTTWYLGAGRASSLLSSGRHLGPSPSYENAGNQLQNVEFKYMITNKNNDQLKAVL